MLPPLLDNSHNLRGQIEQVGQSRNKDDRKRQQHRQTILLEKHAREAGGPSSQDGSHSRVGQCCDNGESALQGEVDREQAILKRRELRTGERPERDDSANESLYIFTGMLLGLLMSYLSS